MQSIDVITDWMLKPKVFYLSHSFPFDFFRDWNYQASHMQYPLLLPALFLSIFKISGSVHETFPLLISPIVYTIILYLVFRIMRKLDNTQQLSLLYTYIYSMFSLMLAQGGRGHAGNADIYLVLCGWLTLRLLVQKTNASKTLWLVAGVVAVASQIKLEGIFLGAILVFYPTPFRKKILPILASIIPATIWIYIVHKYTFASDIIYRFISPSLFLQRISIVIAGTAREMLNWRNWYIFWPLTLSTFWIDRKHMKIFERHLLTSSAFMFLGYVGAYTFAFFTKSEINTFNYVSSSIDRVLFHLSPFVFLVFTRSISRFLLRERK